MKQYTLSRSARLASPLPEVFPFFASAANLEEITPPWLNFEFLSDKNVPMEVGARIQYRIRLHGIPVRWTTKITVWNPPYEFVDEQISGPFRRWVHQHRFESTPDGGTIASDRVFYSVPGGALIHRLFVKGDLDRIFDYREKVMLELFDRQDEESPVG
ncbi:MAG: SRPBCC family protein [Planctomycetota bacterium]